MNTRALTLMSLAGSLVVAACAPSTSSRLARTPIHTLMRVSRYSTLISERSPALTVTGCSFFAPSPFGVTISR